MTTPVIQCKQCYGSGVINYVDDDGYDQQPCGCTIPVEVKR